jgi:hypothetical protein
MDRADDIRRPVLAGTQQVPPCHQDAHGALGQIRVPSAPAARWCVMAVQTACVWGKTQLFSPAQPMVRASVHSAPGWKKREQKRPALGAIRGWQSSADAKRSIEWGPQSQSRYVKHSSHSR